MRTHSDFFTVTEKVLIRNSHTFVLARGQTRSDCVVQNSHSEKKVLSDHRESNNIVEKRAGRSPEEQKDDLPSEAQSVCTSKN